MPIPSVGRRHTVPIGPRSFRRHRDSRGADDLHNVDCVFHLAAPVTIRGSFESLPRDLDTNVLGTARLLRALELCTSVVHALRRCGLTRLASPPRSTNRIEAALSPTASAAARKCLEPGPRARAFPLPASVSSYLRPGQTYTPYVGVLTIFITRLLRGESITIFGDGEQQRDFIHVSDIVAGAMAAPGRTPGRYNLGTGRGTSLNQLATMVVNKLAPGTRPTYAAPQAGELRFSVANIDAARRELGFVTQGSLQADLDDVVAAVRGSGKT